MKRVSLPRPVVLFDPYQLVERVGDPGGNVRGNSPHGHLGEEIRTVLAVLTVEPVPVQVPGIGI
jgi:hypothetical protein